MGMEFDENLTFSLAVFVLSLEKDKWHNMRKKIVE